MLILFQRNRITIKTATLHPYICNAPYFIASYYFVKIILLLPANPVFSCNYLHRNIRYLLFLLHKESPAFTKKRYTSTNSCGKKKRLSLFIPEIARMPPMERHFPSFGTWMFQFPLRCFAINEQRRTYSDKDMLVKSLIMLSSTAGCLLTGAGQAEETHASLQSPDGRLSWRLHAGSQAAHSLKKAAKRFWNHPGWASS